VYGTLMRGRSNHRFLSKARFLGPALVHEAGLFAVTPHYPGVVREPGKTVRGEVYEVDGPTLAALDRLEGAGELYRRELFPAVLEETGETVSAWVYLWLGPVPPGSEVPLERQPWRPVHACGRRPSLVPTARWPRPNTPAWRLLHHQPRTTASRRPVPETAAPGARPAGTLRVLHLLAQQPGKTGSGIYLEALVRHGARAGIAQRVVVGIPAGAPLPVLSPLAEGQVHAVRFGAPPADFPVPGMSDVMPYESTRFSEFTPAVLDGYLQAFHDTLTEAVKDFEPHIIHSHHLWLVTALARVMFPETPLVCTCHGTDLRQLELVPALAPFVVPACSGVDRVLALHSGHVEKIAGRYGLPPGRVVPVGAGYRDDIFRPAAACLVPRRREVLNIVYAGKLSRAKGLPWLIEAVNRLDPPGGLTVRLLVAGSGGGEEAAAIQQQAAVAGDRVTLLGALPQEELAEVFRSADLFVLPSFYEGLPLVVLESVACGCRVVVTDLPGMDTWLPPALDRSGLVERVPRPRLRGPDEPEPEDLSRFTADLAVAITRQLERCLRGEPLPSGQIAGLLAAMTWEGVCRRVQEVYRQTLAEEAREAVGLSNSPPGSAHFSWPGTGRRPPPE
jgi:glycosyltransferase involved in cell wall biosynthesis/gamma-glutamylcyclotransferase (GGCT)/AIG2-like uncharacterized protein YtfP